MLTTTAPSTRALDYAINTAEGPAALEQGVRTVLTLALAEFQHADPATFVLLPLTQGVTNILFKCTLTKPDGTANKVLVRIYGAGTEAIIDRDKEIRVLKFLGEHGVCPPVYATFKNGMVYGYVQGRSLQPAQLADKAAQIGAAVARLHQLTALAVREQILPLTEPLADSTPPCQQFSTLRAWSQQLPAQVGEFTRAELTAKIDWLEAALLARGMRTVFSHNDLLGPNIILTPDERIFFIDYEYANYNLRGFDFANHFCEYAGFELDYTRYPSLETRRAAVQGYLTESKLDLAQVDAVVREIEECVPLSHLFWGVWGLVQHGISTIQFDYLSYGRTRLAMYETTRQILVRAEHEQTANK